MYKQVSFHGAINERTGYGVHGSRISETLSKLIPVNFDGQGDVHISLLDTVTASQITTFPPKPSILYNVWEATEQPAEFIEKLKNYSQLWVASEAQRSWNIAQGVPEEFVKVLPEGIDPDIFKPIDVQKSDTFNFLVVGQWQRRKSTLEIVQSFLKAFPKNKKVRLYLSTDTLYPSDNYKSTEERLAGNGIFDDRIIPVHFESREDYVRRLQTCNVYVQCSRSEGFGLPGIEAMACGAVSILENWGGSTEYSDGALLVNVPKLEKPEGIYGNWHVSGMWGSPDYNHLVEVMKDAYDNYDKHKAKALITSTKIRTKFSWAEAAKKAYNILEELSQKQTSSLLAVQTSTDPEESIRILARSFGYEITGLKKRSVIFTVDCHPSSQEKLDTLIETLKQIKSLGYPILVTSHLPLPANVIEMVDFYIYDKRDVLSPSTDMPRYWRTKPDGATEYTYSSIPCHAVAALQNVRNAIDFCLGKYDWIYQMSSDTEVDLADWLKKVQSSTKDMICSRWENQENTISGQLTAMKTELMDKITPRISTWEEFAKFYGDTRFDSERGYHKIVSEKIGLDNVEILTLDLGNRFNQVDTEAWKDDQFQCHFVEGPFLNIVGMSDKREYDVTYSNPIDGNYYGLKQKPGMWSRPDKKYFREWTITAKLGDEVKFEHTLDLKGMNVIMSFGSKALGDTIAWIPYIDEFRKKTGCNVYCSTWWNHIMDYPEIHFIQPGDTVQDVYASYEIGCFDDQLDKNVTNWRLTPLQKVASDILGLEYEPIRAKLKYIPYKPKGNGKPPKPYICFSEFSTMQNKLWNRPGAWQKVIDYCNSLGYDCVSVSVEPSQLEGIVKHNGQSVEQTLTDLSGAKFYIGCNAGPTWLATALGIPYIQITGVSEEWNDFPNPYRVSVDTGCKPCFNDPTIPIDRGWDWCINKDKFVCTREITEKMVIAKIDNIIGVNHASDNIKRSRRKVSGKNSKPSSLKGNLSKKGKETRAVA